MLNPSGTSQLSLPAGKTWLFLVGVDRGGTTITTKCLNTHPDISVDIERAIIPRYETLMAKIRENRLQMPGCDPYPAIPEDLDTIAAIWEHQLRAGIYEYYGRRPQRYVGDKLPWYIHRIDSLRALFPGSKFILNWREPLGTIASWKVMPWRRYLSLQEMVQEYNRIVTRIRSSLHSSDALVVYHEQLMTEPEREFQRIAEFLDIPYVFNLSAIHPVPPKVLDEAEREWVLAHAFKTL